MEVTDDLRHTMAVLFRHLLTGGPSPRNLYMAAAVELETTPEAVKQASKRLRDRINRERVQRLEDVKALGHYLITTTRSVTEADLDVTRTTE